jgi:hypothetical protein
MTRVYARREGDRKEKLGALAISLGMSVGVAAVSYYVARLFLSRDAIELEPPTPMDTPEAVRRLPRATGARR